MYFYDERFFFLSREFFLSCQPIPILWKSNTDVIRNIFKASMTWEHVPRIVGQTTESLRL